MTCPFTSDELCAWAQGETDEPDAAARIEQHVASCAECRALADEMREALALLRAADIAPLPLPRTIGRYQIRGRLGEGGMGVVYDAEQSEPRRRVALKVIRGSLGADEVQRRLFARELQALARLNHPDIAAVYDAGRTEQGEPYFVMEYVEGADLHAFAQGPPRPELRERLAIVVRIARAISHAHERGIVHRDLKPSNILIVQGNRTQPKVLDFGLARALDADHPDARTTRPGMPVGTLAYMSPEQARGDADGIDIRADVYALGVILFELITGVLPLDVTGDNLARALQRIEGQAPRDPRTINRELPRDVALIALKCLAKPPSQRYGNAAELAADLERYLAGHPISARSPSRLYHAQRFVARNALPVALVALLFAAVSIGGVSAALQARGIAQERDRVRDEAGKVANLNRILENLWQAADPWKAGYREARVLDVLADVGKRVEVEMADTPLLAAAVRNTLGNTWRSLGTLDDYTESERHLRFALEVRTAQLGPRHADTATSANDLAETLYWKGAFVEAAQRLREAIEARRGLSGPRPAELAESLNNLGSVLKQLDQLTEAQRQYDEALAIRQELYQRALGHEPASKRERAAAAESLAETRNNLAALKRAQAAAERDRGETTSAGLLLEEALTDYRAALELRRVWLGDGHPSTATSHNNLARALQDARQLEAAEAHLNESLRILRAGLGERHQLVARALYNLARLKRERGALDEARALSEQAFTLRTELLGPSHKETMESMELLQALSNEP